jgi:peptidoglycan/xylan/chitin deacetylase (PgdA/CDA1 family)
MGERLACMTIDLEPDFLSRDSHEVLCDEEKFGALAEMLIARDIPVTAFLVAKMLEQGLPVRERFSTLDAEFQLHSYSHDPAEPDSRREIERSAQTYREHFGSAPHGYRAPLGFISADGVRELAAQRFEYSASIFPSNRRELGFDFRKLPTEPWMWSAGDRDLVMEIPFGVSLKPRVVVCESYLKLLGMGPYRMLYRFGGFPDVLVIDTHLYDFFATAPVLALSRTDPRRYALLRNQGSAIKLLERLVAFLRGKGYRFVKVGDVHDRLRERLDDMPRVDVSRIEGTQYRTPPPDRRHLDDIEA